MVTVMRGPPSGGLHHLWHYQIGLVRINPSATDLIRRIVLRTAGLVLIGASVRAGPEYRRELQPARKRETKSALRTAPQDRKFHAAVGDYDIESDIEPCEPDRQGLLPEENHQRGGYVRLQPRMPK
jgi:hypothetical protein